ncbi:MAG: thioredoxin-like domain-containing protein, partial [Planctomycetaceae bacterium]
MANVVTDPERDRNSAADNAAQPRGNGRLWGLMLLLSIGLAGGFVVASGAFSNTDDNSGDPVAAGKPDDTGTRKPGKAVPPNPFPKRFKAPSLEGGTEWLNTSGPISMKDLRGKIVLLDFWTYCCINCLHVLPDLKALEKQYPKQIVVIGVHSAKFDNEKDSANIRKAILRHEIGHPVINDSRMTVWRKFGASAWPTLVIVDPEGFYCGYVTGEGNRPLLDLVIKKLIAHHKAKATLDESPIHFDLERFKHKPTPLRFPGKVLVDEEHQRLFIADTSHNRIVVSTLDGKLKAVIGTGVIGNKDGPYAEASFDHPMGMTLVGETLYIADTENHLIRTVNLTKKTVSTLAGTGKQARRRYAGGKLREVPLNSPWAVAHVKGTLYICMAGPHQIWSHKLGSNTLEVFAGSGREDIINGPHLEAALAQPSGITTDGKHLWVADSEGSAIREIDLDPKGRVSTVAGTSDMALGRSLFEFGDKDGTGDAARLQHPLGVAWHNGALYVADAYNHKIRKIELPEKGVLGGIVTTFLGTGKRGTSLKPPRFSEPSGVAVAAKAGKLFIADSNNHRICTADLKTGTVKLLTIAGLKPPKPPAAVQVAETATGNDTPLAEKTIPAGKPLALTFSLKLPDGFKLNPEFPHRFRLSTKDKQGFFAKDTLRVPAMVGADGKTLTAT